jgi:hypothetical protein
MLRLPTNKLPEPGNLPEDNKDFSQIGGHWIDMYLIFRKTKKCDGF